MRLKGQKLNRQQTNSKISIELGLENNFHAFFIFFFSFIINDFTFLLCLDNFSKKKIQTKELFKLSETAVCVKHMYLMCNHSFQPLSWYAKFYILYFCI